MVGGGRLPIINISGGTEVGACFITPYPVEDIKVCSLGGASHGMDIDVFDPDGNPIRGEVGELVCKRPWPGMTRGIWGDPERYMETYWSMYPDVWRHGDWALIDEDGDWYLLGRSDDTINVAGKRLGPAEVESVLVSHPMVAESAVVGVPHETKGEAIWCFCVATDGATDGVAEELRELVATELGRPFKPSRVVFVDALPKTRSAKILRRAVRAVAIGEDPGDMSSAENPQALEQIRSRAGLDPLGLGVLGAVRRVDRVDAAHDLLDEVGGARDRVWIDALRRVGGAVELGHAAVRIEAADRDRRQSRPSRPASRRCRCARRAARAQLLAQPHEALIAAEHQRIAVGGHVVHVAMADRVDVHEERVARVELGRRARAARRACRARALPSRPGTRAMSRCRAARCSCSRRPISISAATPEALVEAPGEGSEIAASMNSIT